METWTALDQLYASYIASCVAAMGVMFASQEPVTLRRLAAAWTFYGLLGSGFAGLTFKQLPVVEATVRNQINYAVLCGGGVVKIPDMAALMKRVIGILNNVAGDAKPKSTSPDPQ